MKIAVPNVISIESSRYRNAPINRFVTKRRHSIAVPQSFAPSMPTRMTYNRTIEGGRHRLKTASPDVGRALSAMTALASRGPASTQVTRLVLASFRESLTSNPLAL